MFLKIKNALGVFHIKSHFCAGIFVQSLKNSTSLYLIESSTLYI